MKKLKLQIIDKVLKVSDGKTELALDWPAVAVSLGGKVYSPKKALGPVVKLSQEFEAGPLHFRVAVIPVTDVLSSGLRFRPGKLCQLPIMSMSIIRRCPIRS